MIEYFLGYSNLDNLDSYNNVITIDESDKNTKHGIVKEIIKFTISLLVSSLALFLSWQCNSIRGLPLLWKIFYGFFSFNFGSMYLLYYILFINGTCVPIPK